MKIIEVSGLSHTGFFLEEGKTLGIIGSGRDRLMERILGLREAEQGCISVLGGSLKDAKLRQQVGISAGIPGFPQCLTPKDISKLLSGLYKSWHGKDFEYLADKLSIPMDKSFGELDEADRRKLSLALAMAPRPRLLILCEPFRALEDKDRSALRSLIRAFSSKEDYSLLISGESPDELEGLCDEIISVEEEVQA